MSNEEKYDKILEKLDNLNEELFDRKTGLAVEVHDNTVFRKAFNKENLKAKIYDSFHFYQSSKKHYWAIYLLLLSIIGYAVKGLLP